MRIEIVTIGNEVLSGRTFDTNFVFLARALEEASLIVAWHTTVGDSVEAISEALKLALSRADAVIMTGGLGPTPDDLTRKAVATALNRPLQLDEATLAHIRERGKKAARRLPASVETMALVPRGAELFQNPVGAVPGILIDHRKKPLFLLPGPPPELEALAREFAVPWLREHAGTVVENFTLRTFGMFESQIHERLGTLPDHWPGASLAYLPSWFGVDLRVTATGTNATYVRESAERAYGELMQKVGGVVYAQGTTGMEEVVSEALVGKNWKIAAAESCTGGLLAKRLTDVPGSSRYLERGFVTYSNDAKQQLLGVSAAELAAHGAVSESVAAQMALGARKQANVDVGVGITGIAGPDGGSTQKPVGTVFIAVSSALGDAVKHHRFMGTRATVRERAAQTALDMLRRHLAGLPLDPAWE
ncbi:MAG TPA: competence/damage-inducible protein A [Methylomirabilota bacterium]|jgi:nicotinamide-nucleotide amidase|nr:competence/damage-inducible protein A [Methylomirabilota bacterium]